MKERGGDWSSGQFIRKLSSRSINMRKSGLETRVQSVHTKAFEWKRRYKKEQGGDWSTIAFECKRIHEKVRVGNWSAGHFIGKLLSRSMNMRRSGLETGVQVT